MGHQTSHLITQERPGGYISIVGVGGPDASRGSVSRDEELSFADLIDQAPIDAKNHRRAEESAQILPSHVDGDFYPLQTT